MLPFDYCIKLNDAEDGCTVFIRNIPFSVDDEQLKTFVEKTGPIKYALVCVDKLTEHSRGTGFAKFLNREDAEKFLSLPVQDLKIEGQVLHVKPALKKESLQTDKKKQAKDNRNLYLVKEGVVVAGTRAAVGVSASDMAKRLALERSKTQMLKNLNRFVSRYRLVVSNLPAHYDDAALRKLCVRGASSTAVVTEARVMRDLRAPVLSNGKHPSKGYGFVMFTRHEDALACLRRLNNNPDIFNNNNRPIVSFSIEDRTALNARKKRLEKSIANNPQMKKNDPKIPDRKNRKRKNAIGKPDESKSKKGNFERKNKSNNEAGKFVKLHNDEVNEYTGLTAKEGSQHKMRSNQKLKMQADVHRQNVKIEKKKNKRAMKLKMAAKERIKQPKQKINKNPKKKNNDGEKKIKNLIKETASFSDLVTKYKSKLSGNSLEKIKSKWILHYFKRIEFQHRGSPHAHILAWLDNAPEDALNKDYNKAIDFLISVSAAEASGDIRLQTHKHTFTCYKGIASRRHQKCRFEAPFMPVKKTMILTPMPDTENGFQQYKAKYSSIRKNLEKYEYSGFQSFYDENNIASDEEYVNIIRAGINRPRVFLRFIVLSL
ncbi:RNA-binding protein 28 [Eumeta japonica]|uniref:RNA-binding protein 28 n=1 Tax=Eumeta variegata TaxID=151549 RepID=A0A4C1SWI9_EUMVA|nr:RNA-binding protein 28 [Eumeta japonica]